jgi:16S rRNA processing protein RimM
MTARTPDRLLAGEVGKPHGLAGEVYVVPISDDPRRFEPGSTLLREDGSPLTIAAVHRHGNRMLVRFDGVSDRASAESLRGPLYVASEEARALEENEFWPHDLIGCTVTDGTGDVGRVVEVVAGSAQDLLRVDTPNGERMIPLVGEIVVAVDTTERRVTIDPPEGLLD